MQKKSFRFSPTKAVAIPKAKGGYRPLQVPEIKDRVVIKALAIVAEEELKSHYKLDNSASFAYQKKLGVEDAIYQMYQFFKSGNEIILEADIEKFFDTVDKKKLLDELVFPKLKDQSINHLIKGALNQNIGGVDKLPEEARFVFESIEGGIPQGNALSPLFSNVYLNSFDILMIDKGYNLVRYADDFVVLCKDNKEAKKAYLLAKKELEENLGLKIHKLSRAKKSKTKIIKPSKRRDFSFLSVGFDGVNLFPTNNNFLKFKENLTNAIYDNKSDSILGILQKVNFMLDGWISNYYYCDIERYILDLDDFIDTHLYNKFRKLDWRFSRKSLRRRNWKGREIRLKLSEKQRENSGVLPTRSILNEKRSYGKMERWRLLDKK